MKTEMTLKQQAAAELLRRMDAATAWRQLPRSERREAAMELMLKNPLTEADRDLLRVYFVDHFEELASQAAQEGDHRSAKKASKVLAAIAQ